MNQLDNLNNILLSDNIVEKFHNEYFHNVEFRSWLKQVLPEVEDCRKQEQDNPWHKYNVLDHILHSVEAMNNQTVNLPYNDRRLLAYPMFLHDIGKPECHIRRIKNGKEIDSFFNHNIASERIAKRVSNEFGFSQDESKILAKLVYKHDIFMNIKLYDSSNKYWQKLTPNLVDKHIQDLSTVGNGTQLMKYLVMVGRSDNLAQNEKMTAESLDLLDHFDEMIRDKELNK